ncbi:hypothetical protein [Pseudoalteromonas xiamenensis]
MKNVKFIGVVFGGGGALLGSYFSFTAVQLELISGNITGQQAGVFCAILAIVLGFSLAVAGILSNHTNRNK